MIISNDPARAQVELPVTLTCEAPPNAVPVAAFTATPREGVAPLEVTLDAGDAHDPEGPISAYEWDLGDGTTAEGETHTHTFEEPGPYEVTLLVRDDAGQEDTAGVTVRVAPPDAVPPTARIEASPASGTERAPVTVTFTADADDSDGTVTDYAWTIEGDAHSGDEVKHAFEDAGTFDVELVVTDDDGATARVSASYEVLPDLYAVPDAVAFDLGASPRHATHRVDGRLDAVQRRVVAGRAACLGRGGQYGRNLGGG
ncbi:MAG: PKD domain-containing protein [Trueperaceae bacterium]|nr:PKD domain-containing protein [Trueperaceae bacterium]